MTLLFTFGSILFVSAACLTLGVVKSRYTELTTISGVVAVISLIGYNLTACTLFPEMLDTNMLSGGALGIASGLSIAGAGFAITAALNSVMSLPARSHSSYRTHGYQFSEPEKAYLAKTEKLRAARERVTAEAALLEARREIDALRSEPVVELQPDAPIRVLSEDEVDARAAKIVALQEVMARIGEDRYNLSVVHIDADAEVKRLQAELDAATTAVERRNRILDARGASYGEKARDSALTRAHAEIERLTHAIEVLRAESVLKKGQADTLGHHMETINRAIKDSERLMEKQMTVELTPAEEHELAALLEINEHLAARSMDTSSGDPETARLLIVHALRTADKARDTEAARPARPRTATPA